MDSSSKSTVERSHRRLRCEYYMLAVPAIRLSEATNNYAKLDRNRSAGNFLIASHKNVWRFDLGFASWRHRKYLFAQE